LHRRLSGKSLLHPRREILPRIRVKQQRDLCALWLTTSFLPRIHLGQGERFYSCFAKSWFKADGRQEPQKGRYIATPVAT